jgi:hypothetical protein
MERFRHLTDSLRLLARQPNAAEVGLLESELDWRSAFWELVVPPRCLIRRRGSDLGSPTQQSPLPVSNERRRAQERSSWNEKHSEPAWHASFQVELLKR